MIHPGNPVARSSSHTMLTNLQCTVPALAIVLYLLQPLSHAEGRPARVSQIPNGAVFGCANCHDGVARWGGPLNAFGQEIEKDFLSPAGVVIWGPELAALDADNDGATNGEELGDPEGTWEKGEPDPGNPETVTNPGDPTSRPQDTTPTAVRSTMWAHLKMLVQSMLE